MKLFKWLLALTLTVLGLFLGWKHSFRSNKDANQAKRKLEENLEKTPASELINAAPNADDLRRRKERIQSELKGELKDILDRNLPHAREKDSTESGNSN